MWSPQARAAALAARKRKSKGHTTSARHIGAKYTVTAQHPGKHSQFKAKAKKAVKATFSPGNVQTAARYAVVASISPATVKAKAASVASAKLSSAAKRGSWKKPRVKKKAY